MVGFFRREWRDAAFPDADGPEGPDVGLIAQEVEAVVPDVVQDGPDGYKAVAYSKLIGYLVEAIKDLAQGQRDESDRVDDELALLRRENTQLHQRLAALEARL